MMKVIYTLAKNATGHWPMSKEDLTDKYLPITLYHNIQYRFSVNDIPDHYWHMISSVEPLCEEIIHIVTSATGKDMEEYMTEWGREPDFRKRITLSDFIPDMKMQESFIRDVVQSMYNNAKTDIFQEWFPPKSISGKIDLP